MANAVQTRKRYRMSGLGSDSNNTPVDGCSPSTSGSTRDVAGTTTVSVPASGEVASSGDQPEKLFCVNPSEGAARESPKFAAVLLNRLNTLRVNGELCDLEICAADGASFPVHQAVVAAASDYFRAMLRADMREAREQTATLKGVTSGGLQAIIQFAYTGQLSLTQDNIEEVLSAATHLQVTEAVDLCVTFLEALVTHDTCIDILNLAEIYSLDRVTARVIGYMLEKFETFADTEHFLALKASQLSLLLRANNLHVGNEYRVFERVVHWVERDQTTREEHVADLITHVRLPLLTGEELVEKVSNISFMRENRCCNDLLTEAKDYHIVVAKQPVMQNSRTQVRSDQPSLVMCHAENLESYNLHTKRHSFLKDCVIAMYNPCACVVNNYLYVCGGRYDCNENSEIASARCFRYDPRFDAWFELNPMTEARKDFVMLAVGQELLAFGGQDENMVMCTVERFLIGPSGCTNDWKMRISMRHAVFCHAGTVCDDLVYISGGQRHDGFSQALALYDPQADMWTERASMLNKRGNHLMEAVDGRLYVLGGNVEDLYGFPVSVVSVEMYDPGQNQWTLLKAVFNIRDAGSSVCGTNIFIAGGLDGDHYFSHALQKYDTVKDVVQLVDRFPTRIYGRACSILYLPQSPWLTLS